MKKILSLALVLVIALGMMTTVSAASLKITGYNPTIVGQEDVLDISDVEPGDVFYYVIANDVGDMQKYFATNDKAVTDAYTTLDQWFKLLKKSANVRVRLRSGPKVVEDISFVQGTHAAVNSSAATSGIFIKVEVIDPFVSVNDADFEVEFYLELDGKRADSAFKAICSGTLANEVTEVSADSVEADTWDGQVVEATEYVGKIALVGNKEEDVIAHVKMANGKKIYFRVVTDGDIKDEPVFDKYPSIEWAYTVQSVGLSNTSGNFMELAGVDETYYVYGKNADGSLKYLGRGGELLPYSAKYYVSSAKLELDEDITEELPEEDEVPDQSYNPSTGI